MTASNSRTQAVAARFVLPATHYTRHGSPVCHTCADGIEQSYIRNRNEPYQEPRPIQR